VVNWQEIDTVLLDMDGTLLDLHFDNYFWLHFLPERYASHHGCTLEESRRWLQALSDSLHGHLNWYCLDHWTEQCQMDIHALKEEVRHLIRFRPGTSEFLDYLRLADKQAILVTNAHPKAMSLKMASSGLDGHMDTCYSSHTFSLAKENDGFWTALQSRTGLDYSRCLFIDDSLNVLRCAKREGLPHIIQVLHPDTSQPPREPSEFPGVHNLMELVPA
jgi:HAD superfamily hydrolase (TIGR01509 family)